MRKGEESAPPQDATLPLESLSATELKARIGFALGIDVPLHLLLEGISISRLAEECAQRHAGRSRQKPSAAIKHDPAHRFAPFPLTDIQRAYLLGRDPGSPLGGVATHYYSELDLPFLDLGRATEAFNRVVQRHDMLRAIATSDGHQRVLRSVPYYEIEFADLRTSHRGEIDAAIEATRASMSHRVADVTSCPPFEVRALWLPGQTAKLCVSCDLLFADAQSLVLVLRDWKSFYDDPDAAAPALRITFRDYVTYISEQNGEQRERSQRYWRERLAQLPGAPSLPIIEHSDVISRFTRHTRVLSLSAWTQLKQRAHEYGVTPAALLCCAFGEVIGKWSNSPDFSLNVTLNGRQPLHADVAVRCKPRAVWVMTWSRDRSPISAAKMARTAARNREPGR